MAKNSNIYSQGSGGSSFETAVQTAFFLCFLLKLHLPGVPGTISDFRMQASSLGYLTDDLYLECGDDTEKFKVLFQIKHNLVISDKGEKFFGVIANAWTDFSNESLFKKEKDRIFIVKSDLTLDEKNHLNVILDWARSKSSAADFFLEVNRISAKRKYLDMIRFIIKNTAPDADEEDLFLFCRCLYFLEMDFEGDNSLQKASFLSLIDRYKTNDNLSADEIWAIAYEFLSTGNPNAAQMDTAGLPDKFLGYFSAEIQRQDIKAITRLSRQNYEIVDFIGDSIGGYSFSRTDLADSVDRLLNQHNTVLIIGPPGGGKSALAKSYIQMAKEKGLGFILCFKADELGDGNLRDYFAAQGIHLSLEEIFAPFSLNRQNLIYIDALEKLLETNGTAFGQLLSLAKRLPNTKISLPLGRLVWDCLI